MRKASHRGSKQHYRSCSQSLFACTCRYGQLFTSQYWQSYHVAISLTIACSRYIYNGVILHTHPIRGESHNECNTTGEVAITSPRFYNEPHRSHVLCVKAELGTTSTSWSQHHFVAIGNPEGHVRKASHHGQARRQDVAAGGSKTRRGATFKKYSIGCMQQAVGQT